MIDEMVEIGVALIVLVLLIIRALRPSGERHRRAESLLNLLIVVLLAAFLVISALRFIQLAAVDPPPTPGPNPSRADISSRRG